MDVFAMNCRFMARDENAEPVVDLARLRYAGTSSSDGKLARFLSRIKK